MNVNPCTKPQLQSLFRGYYAKYLSQHNSNRHYIITYNENTTFTNSIFENNEKIGTSNGIYSFVHKNEQCLMNIQYQNVFSSPNVNSPFHTQNSFYPHLSNYTLGPFYTVFPKERVIWLPILYNHLQMEKGFKVLNFYKNNTRKPT